VEPSEAKRLLERSNELYEKRLRTLPETTYGHALEHYLMLDPNAQRAVTIAEKNRDLRPNGEARTRVAQAYFRAGRVADARAEIDRVLESKWRSAESFATAAVILRHAGDAKAARAAADKAIALNPHAVEESAWLEDHLSSK
jgi:tetratricopeptide (TPR) repeat protein